MQEISEGLRYTFQTDSKYTLMVSGTGHAGMEAAIANLLEPGEKIIVGNAGIWGERVADLSARYGGKLTCRPIYWSVLFLNTRVSVFRLQQACFGHGGNS